MKKLIALLMAGIIVVGISGCGAKEETTETPAPAPTTGGDAPAPAPAPTTGG